mmetsp:Transcript_89812/g.164686  ORF Transcript_89812/g.164686 Transcript_89812/m.164686 type:complete len:350 (+) Transcript_89812:73-1122(+)
MAETSVKLGSLGAEVSPVGWGFMSVGGGITYYDESMKAEVEKAFDKFVELGGNHIDTSDVYGDGSTGGGESEKILAELIKKHGREKFFIATKMSLASFLSKEEKFAKWGGPCTDPEYVKEACDQSLARLGIDCIDLYYSHRFDAKTPIEETAKAFKELVDAGKVKYVGVSEHTPEQIRAFNAVCPLTAVQQEWSVMARDLEADIVPTCKELGIGVVAYSPLARGLLTGTQRSREEMPKDWRTAPADSPFGNCGRYDEDAMPHNVTLADKFGEVAKAKGCTPAQLSLAWVLKSGALPIPGTSKSLRLEENMKSAEVVLSDEDMIAIQTACPPGEVRGKRYSGPFMTYNGA